MHAHVIKTTSDYNIIKYKGVFICHVSRHTNIHFISVTTRNRRISMKCDDVFSEKIPLLFTVLKIVFIFLSLM